MEKTLILAINPGSTSTKVALYREEERIEQENITHSSEAIDKFDKIADQYEYRREMILDWLKGKGVALTDLRAVVGRGGLLRPMPSGTYTVTDQMCKDLQIGYQGEHASNLGGLIAKSIGDELSIPSYIVDPVAVDEFDDVARISGIPQITRRSLLHALNIKAITHRVANEKGTKVEDLNLIVAHLGGGISITPLRKGKMIDANNANEMGPFSPERAGSVPAGDLAKMCFSGEFTAKEIKTKLRGKGGLVAYLGTNDAREVLKMIEEGNEKAKLVFEAMGYQIAKEIGSAATALHGKVDNIVLTGGVAYSKYLTSYIEEHVSFIAPVLVRAGEDEMLALNEGALRVLRNEESALIYENEVEIND